MQIKRGSNILSHEKANQLQTAIPITIIGDYIAEEEEYYYLQISDPQGADFNTGITEINLPQA